MGTSMPYKLLRHPEIETLKPLNRQDLKNWNVVSSRHKLVKWMNTIPIAENCVSLMPRFVNGLSIVETFQIVTSIDGKRIHLFDKFISY
jgi:hypothetical protein